MTIDPPITVTGSAASSWFSEARFGIFIHWGLYSVHGRDVWSMYHEQTPVEEYDRLADAFRPGSFSAEDWAMLCKEAGARYMVMCTRQHDGFSLFDSGVSDFTSVKRAAGRDFVGEYAEAARRAGLRVGFYYSLLDWRYPAYFAGPRRDPEGWHDLVAYVHAQVQELCTQYGKVDVLWYDGAWPYDAEAWRSKELNAAVRSWQPGIIINDRSGVFGSGDAEMPEDFDTPEQRIAFSSAGRPWEACMTMNGSWGYGDTDAARWTPTTALISSLVLCASCDGNLLLNVGPDPDGAFPLEAAVRLRAIGRWLEANGESVYGTDDIRTIFPTFGAGMAPAIGMGHTFPTLRGQTLYTHVHNWPGKELTIGNLAGRLLDARFLADGTPISARQEGPRVFLSGMPQYAPDPYDTVIALRFDAVPRAIDRFA